MAFETPDAQLNRRRLLVWWILWFSIFAGLFVINFAVVQRQPIPKNQTQEQQLLGLIALVPLVISVVIRWLVLPRYTDMTRAFVVFIVGLTMADGCGILGMFLGGPYRDDLFLVGLFAVAQYIPIFARAYIEPKPSRFIPNN